MLKQAILAQFLVKIWVKLVTFDSLDQFLVIFVEKRPLMYIGNNVRNLKS
jgi:hypothetical protein